jgi:septation ring formation regulator EzrA
MAFHIHHYHHHVEARCEVMRRLDALDSKIDLILNNQEMNMSTFEELKASQDAITALVGKVKADVDALHAKLDAIPAAGMTPEQQAALDDAVTSAKAIAASLSSVDDLTPEA